MKRTVWASLALFALTSPLQADLFVTSPNGQLQASVQIVNNALYYTLQKGGQTLLDSSRLGLVLQSGGNPIDIGANVTGISTAATSSVSQAYNTIGWHATALNQYNGLVVNVQGNGGASPLTVELRAFNEGLAFRYTTPTGASPAVVDGEPTSFNLPATASAWVQTGSNADYANSWTKLTIAASATASNLMGPVVVDLGNSGEQQNGYISISESDNWDYSGMTYKGAGSGTHTITANFLRDATWEVAAGSPTAWRTVTVAPNLTALVNSDLINNVARAPSAALYPQGVKTPWIVPGRSVWGWLDPNGSGVNTTQQMLNADAAHRFGFEYITIDSGWKNWSAPGKDAFAVLADVISYAGAEGVKALVWKNSQDFVDATGQFDIVAAHTFLDKVHTAGAAGVKVDFLRVAGNVIGESNQVLTYMSDMYEYAAGLHMVVVFHGAPKDVGQSISYPNGLTTEDLRGLESGASATHDATLPFTTLLAGPSDYTPGVFSPDSNRGKRGNTTWSHQLAMGVVITSPIIHWASGAQTLNAAFPDNTAEFDVFRKIPSTWDETRVLDVSQIGLIAAFARRSGNNWFLAIVSGDTANAMTLNNLDLSFLGNGQFSAKFLFDDSTVDAMFVDQTVASLNKFYDLDVTMRRGGGFVAMFTALPEPATLPLFALGVPLLGVRRKR